MTLTPGSRLGPYEVQSPLGAGGMGEVFLARDTRLGRDVAIKALPEAFARDPERLARFEREARLLASLNHPNIASIYGLEEVGGHRYLVLEFVDGPTLAERLVAGPIPLTEAIDIARQIAAGVEAAHESGVVHRDLKPGNVKITPAGDVKVLDFGLARGGAAAGTGSDPQISASPTMTYAATAVGVILGTAAYMSPEQARGRAVDRRADIWSFGCVLFEMLTGRALFNGETVSDLIARILEREPDWESLPATVPPRLRELLRRCLRKDPKERLRDIGDARIELAEILAGGLSSQSMVAGAPAGAASAATPARRVLSPAVAAAGLAVVALAAVGAWFAGRSSAPPARKLPIRLSILVPQGLELSGEVPDIVISPDGSRVVFCGRDTTGIFRLWVRNLGSNESVPLAGTEDAKIPFWSPDGKNIAFFAGGELKRIPAAGGATQRLTAATNPRGGAWGPDGTIVFAPAASGPLMKIPADGGDPKPATTLDESRHETAHRFPVFLPDGRHFQYIGLPGHDNLSDTRFADLEGKTSAGGLSAPGLMVYAPPGFVIYNSKGTIVAQPFDARTLATTGSPRPVPGLVDASGSYSGSPVVTVSLDGTLVQQEPRSAEGRIEILSRGGEVPRATTIPAGRYTSPRFSPDGRRVAVMSTELVKTATQLAVLELDRGLVTPITFDELYASDPIFTRDQNYILYAGEQSRGGRDILRRRADGSGSTELLADVPNLFNDPLSLTPDDRFLVYRSLGAETSEDLWILPLEGDRQARPLLQTRFNEMGGVVSPDGRWILYRSDETGRFEAYVAAFPSMDRKLRVSVDGTQTQRNTSLDWLRWRSDGRELYFIGPDGRSVMAADVEPGDPPRIGAPHRILRLPYGTIDADLSPDGQTVVLVAPTGEQGREVINVTMNWQPELFGAK